MNATNRALNRMLVFVVGLLLAIVGAGAAALALVPVVRDAWVGASGTVSSQVTGFLQGNPLGDTGASWPLAAALVLLVLAIVLLIVFVVRQGGGHTRTAVTERADDGTILVDSSVAEHTLEDALATHPEFVASHVSTYAVRHEPVLKISVTCRRGVSPADASRIVDDTLTALDRLLGRELPALVQLSGGFRARVRSTTRLQ
ncbi:hypothetical protein [Herbiconiux sp. YIM B11900]|uniref:hypothetical protein n=1 Tax=Herbiconiux sp. YIM B11900 TaxID=3404131 RepID=UPI003F84C509